MTTRKTKGSNPGTVDTIQLRHPEGKHAVRISREKYEIVRRSLMRVLKKSGQGSYAELQRGVRADLKLRKQKFEGSLSWYLEWVRLDQEARGVMKRVGNASPQEFRLARLG